MTSVGDKPRSIIQPITRGKSVLPLIAIGGSRGKSTVASILDQILRHGKHSVASWISTGVYVDGEQMEGELRPWSRVLLAAKYGELDFVLQALEAAVVVGAGLPERTYPLAILTTICGNDDSCRLSMATEIEERALEAIVGAVRDDGCVIANADDMSVVLAAQEATAGVMMFALHPDNPVLQRHLETGNEAVWVVDGQIVYGTQDYVHPVISVADIPATLDGSLIFQIQNALAATAAALKVGAAPEVIAAALSSFSPELEAQPGACNILDMNGGKIVVDAPMQTWTLKMLARGIKHQPHRRSIIVSGCFPNLEKSEAREVGRILGGLGGVVILHHESREDPNVQAIKAGIASNTVPPLVAVFPDENAAIEQLSLTIGAGDTGLVLSEDPVHALQLLASRATHTHT